MSSNAADKFNRMKKLGRFRASLRLLQDPNASPRRKAAIIAASAIGILYAVFPEATDVFFPIGFVDEAVVLALVRWVLGWLAKQYRTIPVQDR
jgi:uncharacterized membrane protein YkvA (DUF1232 family)